MGNAIQEQVGLHRPMLEIHEVNGKCSLTYGFDTAGERNKTLLHFMRSHREFNGPAIHLEFTEGRMDPNNHLVAEVEGSPVAAYDPVNRMWVALDPEAAGLVNDVNQPGS